MHVFRPIPVRNCALASEYLSLGVMAEGIVGAREPKPEGEGIVGAREPKPEGDGSAGWYPDPQVPGLYRAWDGAMWTDRTSSAALFEKGEDRYAMSTVAWGVTGLLCAFGPVTSWIAVLVCGPLALVSAARNRRLARESGLPTYGSVTVGRALGIAGMAIGAVMSVVYWVLWPSVVAWLNGA